MNSKEILKMYCKEKYDNEIVIKTYSIQEIVQIIDFTKQLMLGGVVGRSEQLPCDHVWGKSYGQIYRHQMCEKCGEERG